MNEMEMMETVEELEELFQKGMKITQKFKQKMGMRRGYRSMGFREGNSRGSNGSGQNFGQRDDYQDNAWFDPRYM